MGFKIGKALGSVGKGLIGGLVGGPAGALAGVQGSSDPWSLLGGQVVEGAIGIGQDQYAANQALKYQKAAADYAYNKNLAMWNLQNAYNDPAAQMARLQAAGLNPNLVYGGGNVTGNAASSGPEYKLDGNVYEDRSIQRQQLQMAMKDHQQRITNQAIENDLARQRLSLAEREADRQDKLAEAQIAAYKSSLGFKSAEIDNMLYTREHDFRRDAWERYKHDVDAYDKRYKALIGDYSISFNKFGFGFKVNSQNPEIRRNVIKKIGFRPKYSDYLNRVR